MRRAPLYWIVMLALLMVGCEAPRTNQPTVTEPVAVVVPTIKPPPEVTQPDVIPPEVTRPDVAPPEVTRPDVTRADNSSDGLLKYFAYIRKLQAVELAKEHDAARQLYAAARTEYNRVRYAMLLSIPGAPFSDDARALDALDPLLKNQNSVLYGVAYMLNTTIQEQRRSQGLQQKLEALRSLEKDLLQRDGAKRK